MLGNPPDTITIYTPGAGTVFDPETGQYVESPPTLDATTPGWFAWLDAEVRSRMIGTYEAVEAAVLLPTGVTINVDKLVDAGPTGRRWTVRGVEYHRDHVQALLG